MAFPLATVLATAPGLISAATDLIRTIRERKNKSVDPQIDIEKLNELTALIEQQAVVIEELAINNRDMALAVRNNRILSTIAVVLGLLAIITNLL